MIVDVHVHSFDELAGLVGRGKVKPTAFGKVRYGTGEEQCMMPPLSTDTSFLGKVLVECMNWAGVEKTMILQGNLYGFQMSRLPLLFTGGQTGFRIKIISGSKKVKGLGRYVSKSTQHYQKVAGFPITKPPFADEHSPHGKTP